MGVLRLLLDTHCWLWLKSEPQRLPSPIRRRLERDPSKLVLSSVCVLEIAIKQGANRLGFHGRLDQFVEELTADGVDTLEMTTAHALQVVALPPLHRDPFDRLLVAQSLVEGLTLVSADRDVLAYDVRTIDARK